MAETGNLIVAGGNNTLSFGNYESEEKLKMEGFELSGDIYKVKSHNQITHLEKNGRLLYESVPGTMVYDLDLDSDHLSFEVEGAAEDAQITVELEADQEYKVFINQVQVGRVKANLAGKISFSVDFASGKQQVVIKKA